MTKPSDDDAAPPAKSRSNAGKFAKGRSGNQAGRRKGTRNRRTILIATLLENVDVEAILSKLEKQAKAGSESAAKILLDRVAPVRRGCLIRIPLPEVLTSADVVKAVAAVIAQMSAAKISTTEAQELIFVIGEARKAIESIDHEARLAAIESRMGTNDDKKL